VGILHREDRHCEQATAKRGNLVIKFKKIRLINWIASLTARNDGLPNLAPISFIMPLFPILAFLAFVEGLFLWKKLLS
jgi:hypothetical protein